MDLIRCNLGFGLLVWVLGFIGLIQFQFQTHKLELAQVRYFLFSTTATISITDDWKREKLTLGVEPFHGESHTSENMLKFKLIIICALCK